MKRFAAAISTLLLATVAGCNEAKQAANEVLNDQKMKARNAATEKGRQAADDASEAATSTVSGKLRGEEGKRVDEEE